MPRTFQAFDKWAQESTQTLAALLSQELNLNPVSDPHPVAQDELSEFLNPAFFVPFTLNGALSGSMLLAVEEQDALALASLLLGEDTTTKELGTLHFEVLAEAFQQMISGIPESLRQSLSLEDVDLLEGSPTHGPLASLEPDSYKAYELPICGQSETFTFHLVLPSTLAENIAHNGAEETASPPTKQLPPAPENQKTVEHSRPDFQPLTSMKVDSGNRDLDLILDVPMEVTAVLGNTSICMEELINLGKGSVLELDKLAGEPVELFVHGRQIAIGEVVVIDERFGVKILEMSNARHANRGSYSMTRVG